MTSGILLDAMIRATQFCFPLLMVATAIIVLMKKPVTAFLDGNERAKAAYDRIVKAGPKEGWSGYVILAAICVWLAAMAWLAFSSIEAGDPERNARLNRSDMVLVEQDEGPYGYVNGEDLRDAVARIESSDDVAMVAIPLWSDGGIPLGEYVVTAADARLLPD